jgi:hypothetical protein
VTMKLRRLQAKGPDRVSADGAPGLLFA